MGKFFKDCKMSELTTLINSCLYETNKYAKIHYMLYNEESCPHNDDFSHVTLDTLALQYSGVNLGIIGSSSNFMPDHTLGRGSSISALV